MPKFHCLLPVLALLSGCSTPAISVPTGLQNNSSIYTVRGLNGWKINQRIEFGAYRAGPVSRGWTRGYDYPFLVRFSGASEKFEFPLSDGWGNAAQVFCLGKLREQDLAAFRNYFEVNLHTRDVFTCSIVIQGGETHNFFAENLNVQQNTGYRPMEGNLQLADEVISLRSIWHLESGQRSLGTEPLGVEFNRNGRAVAAVETVNEGRVWIGNELNESDALVVAATAAALLLRSGLAEHNDPQ